MHDRHVLPPDLQPAITRALDHLARTQDEGGSWKGDYGGPMFLLPMYVCTSWAVQLELSPTLRRDMSRYLRSTQNQDGGWGLHVEAPSYVFTTVLSYLALRLLGAPADDPPLVLARAWIEDHGGPVTSAAWGKFVLTLFHLYEYEGLEPVQPELWLLPDSLPVHPSRLWCHCRMVYLPMSWLYAKRARVKKTRLIGDIQAELYPEGYDRVNWKLARRSVADTDAYVPRHPASRLINRLLRSYEKRASKTFRTRAMTHVLDHIHQEDQNTHYICIGPVSKLLHTLVWFFANPGGPELRAHCKRLPDYLWHGKEGTKMQGYNSSELWDTAFAAQAMLAADAPSSHPAAIEGAHRYIESNQVLEDVPQPDRYYRHPSKGGWPFSDREHGWPISDCTAEGLKAALGLATTVESPIQCERLYDAVEFILSMQNDDGGWATYERTRGPAWLEALNPSDCFADIMIDYSYVECTSASLTALRDFQVRYPDHRPLEIDAAMKRGRQFLLKIQRSDGSFEGSWGICFTYGTWFGITGLRATGLNVSHPAVGRAVAYLEKMQAEDGSWGESAESCLARTYIPTSKGQAVMTSWALLALLAAGRVDSSTVTRAADFLIAGQQADGRWPAEHIAGMFNKTSAIHYDNYLKIFPLWALAELSRQAQSKCQVTAPSGKK